jgi:drug/metabolite transporter (DMT)-like permease
VSTPPPLPRSAVGRPPRADLARLAVGVAAVSTSAPLIAATAAPALAIAFWRTGFGSVAIAPVAAMRAEDFRGVGRRVLAVSVLAGLLLAAHFATWIPSLDYTSVASSTALVATQPIWAALIARMRGHLVPRRAWVGMAVAFSGVLLLTGIDVQVSARALLGDVLALIGAVFAAAYVTVGASARQRLSTTSYTLVCYGSCAAVLLPACLLTGTELTGFDATTWAQLLLLTAVAQLLGHSVLNSALRTTSPTVLSLAILFEMPGATIIAAVWLGQLPPAGVIPASMLLLAGIALVVTGQGHDVPPSIPAE